MRAIARELVEAVRCNVSIDWTERETVRAKLRSIVKRLLQAKRWENSVGREKVQAFQGALAGVGACKGVFLTTSKFTQQAIAYSAQTER